MIIGRERGYHGTNFGGTLVGGIPGNRKLYAGMMSSFDHLRSTHDLNRNAYSKGMPQHGCEFAMELERLILLHDPSNVAAVIVEPMAGSTGVLIPPQGYLQKLRAIADKYGVLLIFDEVITRFRTPRRAVRRRPLRREAGHHDPGQGHQQRRDSDGRGGGEARDP